jgi:hypothetical protein
MLFNMISKSAAKVRKQQGPDLHPSRSIDHPDHVMADGHKNHHYTMTPPVPHPPGSKNKRRLKANA